MKAQADNFPVKKMSEVLSVSKSGYYRWLKNLCKNKEQIDLLNEQIKQVFKASRETYGSPRVHLELKKDSVQISKSTVARRMKLLNIGARNKKRFKTTTDSKHGKSISPNLLNQEFNANKLATIWVSDITYIPMVKGFAYLTTVIDLADRSIVGWALSNNMTDTATSIAAFKKALVNRPIHEGLIFHSDRGSQYASDAFRTLLSNNACVQSMSRKGNCYDNAVAESFFKTIKAEELYHHQFESIQQVWAVVFDYIEGWYNTKRIHSTLGGIAPLEMAKLLAA